MKYGGKNSSETNLKYKNIASQQNDTGVDTHFKCFLNRIRCTIY